MGFSLPVVCNELGVNRRGVVAIRDQVLKVKSVAAAGRENHHHSLLVMKLLSIELVYCIIVELIIELTWIVVLG